ncbi:hypothetical protein BLNAU_2980 [Blattamonas nauphoetae]|uniref:Uncharacterized protein n=1 Tax=Blattamonas nauphoetae TaxID=2049346 RepID=A0ABQ9YEB7_9EUKA|nr:hypothetical protein BLNAU_2980 [Blattamonas nauphoetae]
MTPKDLTQPTLFQLIHRRDLEAEERTDSSANPEIDKECHDNDSILNESQEIIAESLETAHPDNVTNRTDHPSSAELHRHRSPDWVQREEFKDPEGNNTFTLADRGIICIH